MNNLKIKDIKKSYDSQTQIIKDFDLEIEEGEFVVFVGPSGCGKSTVLRMIAGLESVTSGNIFLNGTDITMMPPGKREIAMVFQSYALYPHMTVENNINFGLKMSGMPKAQIKEKIKKASEILQLDKLLKRKPAELSGGQRQRVAIGRAIVRNPKLFLFDEPLSNLDAKLRVEMRLQITQLHKQLKNTMIYVTHDQVEAMTMADKIVVLRDGKIEQVGSPLELYENPANEFVAGFLGSPKMNFLSTKITNNTVQSSELEFKCGRKLKLDHILVKERQEKVIFGVRPEDIEIAEDDSDLEVKITTVEHLGASTLIYTTYDSEQIVLNVQGTFFQNGEDKIGIKIKKENTHLFSTDGKAFTKKGRT